MQKELSIAFYPDSYVFMGFKFAQLYLRSAASRVYNGHLQKGMTDENLFGNIQKVANCVCIKSSLHLYILFIEIPRYLEIPLT